MSLNDELLIGKWYCMLSGYRSLHLHSLARYVGNYAISFRLVGLLNLILIYTFMSRWRLHLLMPRMRRPIVDVLIISRALNILKRWY